MENYVVAIELSATRASMVVAQCDPQEKFGIKVKHYDSHPISGAVKRGLVVDSDVARRAISNLFASKGMPRASEGKTAIHYCLNINGNVFRTSESHARISTQGMINDEVANNLAAGGRKNAMRKEGEDILSIVPRYFNIDGMRTEAQLTLGKKCDEIEASYTTTFVRSDVTTDMRTLLGNRSVSQFYTTTASKGAVLLASEQKENGVALVDFGASTTTIALFVRGALFYEVSIPLGSDLITSDIARALEIKNEYAETLKRAYGIEPDATDDTFITPEFADGIKLDNRILINDIKFFARARTEELISYIDVALQKSEARDRIKRIMLTGGGAQLQGIAPLVSQMLGRPAEVVQIDTPSGEALACALGMASRFARENAKRFAPRGGEQQSLFGNDNADSSPRNEPSFKTTPAKEKKKINIFNKLNNLLSGEEGETMDS